MPSLITADLHLNDNPRDEYRWRIFATLRKLVVKKHVDCVFILGDLTHDKELHSDRLVNRIVEELARLAKLVNVVIDKGNHDYMHDPDTPFFKFVRLLDGVTWVNQPRSFNCEAGYVLVLPHTRDYERDWKKANFSKYDWIFTHQTYDGTIGDYGFRMEGIPLTIFPRLTKVLSGDIHTGQMIKTKNGDRFVMYVGAPYTINFGDSYEPRVLLVTPDDWKSIKVTGPQKRLIELRANQSLSGTMDCQPEDIIKVRMNISQQQYMRWHEITEEVAAWATKYSFVVDSIEPILIAGDGDEEVKFSAREHKSDDYIVREYGKNMGIEPAILKIGQKLVSWKPSLSKPSNSKTSKPG